MSGNQAKYLSYKTAWEQMTTAISEGYFLEAITVQESMMFDRVRSFVEYAEKQQAKDPDVVPAVKDELPITTLLRRWEACLNADKKQAPRWDSDVELPAQAIEWARRRNEAIHGIVKSAPGNPTAPICDFLSDAKKTAEDGATLVRDISDWHRKQLER